MTQENDKAIEALEELRTMGNRYLAHCVRNQVSGGGVDTGLVGRPYETILKALQERQVDVEALKKKVPSEYTPDIEEYDPWEDIGFLEKYYEAHGWNDCVDHLAAQGYLRTPDTIARDEPNDLAIDFQSAVDFAVNAEDFIEVNGHRFYNVKLDIETALQINNAIIKAALADEGEE